MTSVTSGATAQRESPESAPSRFGLIVNIVAGSASTRAVGRLAMALQAAGRECLQFPTTPHARGRQQAAAAIEQGCDAVIACGGDGTVHEALQAIVEDGGRVPLGILPLGTGNVIAHDLGLPRDPNQLATMLLRPARRRVAVGRLEMASEPRPRYFLALVGIGCDAYALYHLTAAVKKFGLLGYYWQSWGSLIRSEFVPFEVQFTTNEGERRDLVTQVLAVRIRDFGGLWRRLAPGASLEREDLRLVLFRGRGRMAFIRYMTAVVLGREPRVPGVDLVNVTSLVCAAPAAPGCVHVQADGEYLGRLPARVSMVPQAVELLVPQNGRF